MYIDKKHNIDMIMKCMNILHPCELSPMVKKI